MAPNDRIPDDVRKRAEKAGSGDYDWYAGRMQPRSVTVRRASGDSTRSAKALVDTARSKKPKRVVQAMHRLTAIKRAAESRP